LVNQGDANIIELSLPIQLDHHEFDKLIEDLEEAMAKTSGDKWIIDLSQVEYTGSAALGLLVNIRQKIKERGGNLVLCGVAPRVSEVLHACSLDRLFKIVSNRAAALRVL